MSIILLFAAMRTPSAAKRAVKPATLAGSAGEQSRTQCASSLCIT